jgi:hypothetical protein
MSEPDFHPSPDELAAFDTGQLTAPRSEAVARHVAACTTCCRTLEGLPEDPYVALVRAYATATGGDTGAPVDVPAALLGHPRYRVLGVLGSGGMGVVYKAVHRLMDRVVALKVLQRTLTERPRFVERFRQEVKALARLDHPHLVRALDAEEAAGLHFLVMDYVEGENLEERVRRLGPLPVAEACDCVRQAALGLQHAHENGMVHRDVKPSNLLRMPAGQLRIIDLGLARLVREEGEADTSSGLLLGTPDYTAPEQARTPNAADIRADLYSLGCTLYFLLAGQVPFPGGTALQKLLAHQERLPRPITELRPDVPVGVVRLLQRLLAKDPAQRPATPAEVAGALAAPAGAAPAGARSRRRTRTLALVLGAAVLLAGAAVTAFSWQRRGRAPSEQPVVAPAEPALATPEQLVARRQELHRQALDWLQKSNCLGPKSNLVSDLEPRMTLGLVRYDGFQVALGSGLVWSGRPTILATHPGGLFQFELRPGQEKDLGMEPGGCALYCYPRGNELRLTRPRLELSDLRLDHAHALPRRRRITGSVAYRRLFSLAGQPSLRLFCYTPPPQKKCISTFDPGKALRAEQGRLTFTLPPLEKEARGQGLLVVFMDLVSRQHAGEVVESNTLAAVVRPVAE